MNTIRNLANDLIALTGDVDRELAIAERLLIEAPSMTPDEAIDAHQKALASIRKAREFNSDRFR